MAHSAVHFAFGMSIGTILSMPQLIKTWWREQPASRTTAQWLILSWSLGILAILPGLLRRAGLPNTFCDGWWMNICLFYPLINILKSGGFILGLIGITFLFFLQYSTIMVAIIKTRKRQHSKDANS